jgi:hypothetical protein
MSDEDKKNDLEVVIDAPEAEAAGGAVPANEVPFDKGIEALKAQLEEEKQKRLAAESAAHESARVAQQAKVEVADNEMHLINNAIEAVKRNADLLKREYAEALSTGAYDRAAEMQELIATNSYKLSKLVDGKEALQSRPAPTGPAINDPVEQVASQLSPRSAAWVRSHPEYVKDPVKYESMLRAHNVAVAEGYAPDSDAYFQFVENRLGFRNEPKAEAEADPTSTAAKPSQRRQSAPAAPSSSVAGSGSGRTLVARLSAEEREIAEMLKMSPEEYAKHREDLRKEGKLN